MFWSRAGRRLAAAGAPLRNISQGDYNIGLFVDGRTTAAEGPRVRGRAAAAAAGNEYAAMLIQNHDASNFRFATVVFPAGLLRCPLNIFSPNLSCNRRNP